MTDTNYKTTNDVNRLMNDLKQITVSWKTRGNQFRADLHDFFEVPPLYSVK